MGAASLTRLAARKILWVEDMPASARGHIAHFERAGHVVICATSYDAAADALMRDAFDLLVVDQQLPRGGRKLDDAGSRLVDALYRGDFGGLNSEIYFVFYTASEDWVTDSEIDVTGFSGCLGIQEKGDDITGALDEHLEVVPANALAAEDDRERQSEAVDIAGGLSGSGAARHAERALPEAEEWRGIVIGLEQDRFRARLTSDRPVPDHEVTLPLEAVSRNDLALAREGAEFVWLIQLRERDSGERVTESRLAFLRTPVLSATDVAEARRRVRTRREGESP